MAIITEEEVRNIILKTHRQLIHEWTTKKMEQFEKRVHKVMTGNENGGGAPTKDRNTVAGLFYSSYDPKSYRRTGNLFNNAYNIHVAGVQRNWWSKRMTIEFSPRNMERYKHERKDIRNLVFNMDFMNGYHGHNLNFFNKGKQGKGQMPQTSPAPIVSSKTLIDKEWEQFKRHEGQLRFLNKYRTQNWKREIAIVITQRFRRSLGIK